MSAAWGAVLVAALALSGTALGFVARMSARWARLEGRINANSDRITELLASLREDRRATNSRLTWLERQIVWRLGPRGPGGPFTGEDTDH